MQLTSKQISQLTVIVAGNPDESPVDKDELLERLPYETSKESLQFSIRALVKRGLVTVGAKEKRRGRLRATLIPTDEARQIMGAPAAGASATYVMDEEALKILEALEA
ncbi:hypothetical protein [Cupriavidus campinensis]|uniref:MarR family transcriptional regulator n=1 Tax=Cupriavidus campinensis TaxID=151783 RepID=A0ABY3ETP6_9BURK|nr:hypothetical protein [Cupriavidus campinensis]TSP13943.1 hypothetical protein FGG12_05565 [Cupriavidus campinensis]